jgi:hypothetical protein
MVGIDTFDVLDNHIFIEMYEWVEERRTSLVSSRYNYLDFG